MKLNIFKWFKKAPKTSTICPYDKWCKNCKHYKIHPLGMPCIKCYRNPSKDFTFNIDKWKKCE